VGRGRDIAFVGDDVEGSCSSGQRGPRKSEPRGLSIEVVDGPGEHLYGEETGLLEVLDGRAPFPDVAVVELATGSPLRCGSLDAIAAKKSA
jgi:hypothetical protein